MEKMMKIVEFTSSFAYTANLGNYESEKIGHSITVSLGDDDSYTKCRDKVKTLLDKYLEEHLERLVQTRPG